VNATTSDAANRHDALRRWFQVFFVLFGATDIAIALLHIGLGPSAIPGSLPVNATMDSEDRFYATLFAAYGVAILWCVKDIERKSTIVYFLLGTFFVGGLARLVSIASVGPPNEFFVAMTVLELVIPLAAAVQYRISRRVP
jgi:Domain of unknown function (DUF4345)